MNRLEDIWWGEVDGAPGALAAPLALAEGAFRVAGAVRAALYAARLLPVTRAGAPVVSIGNLAVGGAGKTPATLAVAERLSARGRRVAVLSRGYGADRTDSRVVSDGRQVLLDAAQAGDEPFLLAHRLPGVAVLCGPRRAELARRAVEQLRADALVLDDGFQHRALARDLDVVVVDAASPGGNGRLLPRGPNREPWAALRRAQLGWISRCDQVPAAALLALRRRLRDATGRLPVVSRHAVEEVLDGPLQRSFGAEVLRGRRVLLLCALARPDGFRRTLAALGAAVTAERVFRDHHRFTGAELEETLRAASRAGCDAVVTTEKDAVRLPPSLAAHPLLRVVRIRAEIVEGAEVLDELLDQVLAPTSTATSTAAPLPNPPPASGGREGSSSTATGSNPPSPPPGEREACLPQGVRVGERGPHRE